MKILLKLFLKYRSQKKIATNSFEKENKNLIKEKDVQNLLQPP